MKINNTIAAFIAICGLLYGANSTMAGDKSLREAAEKGDVATVRQLITAGANINNASIFLGWTPLHIAALKGYTEIARLLISVGADLNSLDRYRTSPLELAMVAHKIDIVEMLVNAGANPPDCEQFREISFRSLTTTKSALGIINSYESGNANLLTREENELTALHRVVKEGTARSIALLLRLGVDANVPCARGLSALDYAAGWQKKDIAEVLCERGADLPQLTVDILREQGMLEACRERSDARLRAVNEWRNELKQQLPNDIVESCILPLTVTQLQVRRLHDLRATSATD